VNWTSLQFLVYTRFQTVVRMHGIQPVLEKEVPCFFYPGFYFLKCHHLQKWVKYLEHTGLMGWRPVSRTVPHLLRTITTCQFPVLNLSFSHASKQSRYDNEHRHMVFPRGYLPPRSAASRGSHDPSHLQHYGVGSARQPTGGEARAAQSILVSDVTLLSVTTLCLTRRLQKFRDDLAFGCYL
jgi:hypothetical protein